MKNVNIKTKVDKSIPFKKFLNVIEEHQSETYTSKYEVFDSKMVQLTMLDSNFETRAYKINLNGRAKFIDPIWTNMMETKDEYQYLADGRYLCRDDGYVYDYCYLDNTPYGTWKFV